MDELRSADLAAVGGVKPMMRILIVTQRPLELGADFARATLQLLDRVFITYILPAGSNDVPRLLVSLTLHEYLGDSARLRRLRDEDRALVAQRWQLLQRHLRVAFCESPLPCHWQIYYEDDNRAAAAVMVTANSEDCVLSAWDKAASDLAATFKSMASSAPAFLPLETQGEFRQLLSDLTGTSDLAAQLTRIP